ncbi:MAG: hypothetical protein ABL927_04905, partial [Bdellovibrionales bacterium]
MKSKSIWLSLNLLSVVFLYSFSFIPKVAMGKESGYSDAEFKLKQLAITEINNCSKPDVSKKSKQKSTVEIEACENKIKKKYAFILGSNSPDESSIKECNSAKSDFDKARNEFISSCKGGDLDSCLDQAITCSVCKSNVGSDVEYCPGYTTYQDIKENKKANTKQGIKEKSTKSSQLSLQAIQIGSCPDVNARLAPGLNKKLEKFNKDQENKEKILDNLKESIQKSNDDIAEADAEFKNTSAELADKLAEQQKDFKNKFSEETKAKQALYDKMNQQLTEYSNAFEKLQQEHDNAINQVEVSCYNEALKQLQEEMAQRRAKLENSALSVNSVSNLFSTAKISQEDINRNRGNTLYNSCQTRPDKIAEKNRIEGAYKTGLKMVNDGISTI